MTPHWRRLRVDGRKQPYFFVFCSVRCVRVRDLCGFVRVPWRGVRAFNHYCTFTITPIDVERCYLNCACFAWFLFTRGNLYATNKKHKNHSHMWLFITFFSYLIRIIASGHPNIRWKVWCVEKKVFDSSLYGIIPFIIAIKYCYMLHANTQTENSFVCWTISSKCECSFWVCYRERVRSSIPCRKFLCEICPRSGSHVATDVDNIMDTQSLRKKTT